MVNTKAAAVMLAILRQLEVNGLSTPTLVIGNCCTGWGAGSDVPAGRTIGHVVDNMHIRVLVCRDAELFDGETVLTGAPRERRSR